MLKSCAMALLCAAVGLGAAPVQAQEVYDWNGFYAGVFGGYNAGDVDYDVTDLAGAPFFSSNPPIEGLFAGVNAGVNYQVGNGFVIGAEADLAASSTSGLAMMYDPTATPMATLQGTVSPMGSVRARAGLAVDRFLPFVTAGVALAQTRFEYIPWSTAVPVPGLDDVQFGWTVGAGLEYAATENISARVEYRFSQFGGSEKAAAAVGNFEKAAFHTHDARIGLNYHF